MVCLHGVEIGSIDLANSITYKLKNSRFAYFLHFPNRSWLRSFCPPWGLGERTARMKRFLAIVTNIKKQENSIKPL